MGAKDGPVLVSKQRRARGGDNRRKQLRKSYGNSAPMMPPHCGYARPPSTYICGLDAHTVRVLFGRRRDGFRASHEYMALMKLYRLDI